MQEHRQGIEARMRMFGLSEKDARDQAAETVIGRLWLRVKRSGDMAGGITEIQYRAGEEYRRQADAYRRALGAPDSLRTGSGGAVDAVQDGPGFEAWAKAVVHKFEGSRRAVIDEQCVPSNRGANLIAALDYLVLRNEMYPHLIRDLRVALNALARHYGMG